MCHQHQHGHDLGIEKLLQKMNNKSLAILTAEQSHREKPRSIFSKDGKTEKLKRAERV